MAKEYSRAQRVAEQMKKEVAGIIMREMKDPRVKMATVSDVWVSGDLKYAKIYVTFLDNDAAAVTKGIRILNRARGFFRTMIGQAMQLRMVPEVTFLYDKSLEEGFRMSGLITEAVRHDAELREEAGPDNDSADDDNNSQDNSSEVAENSDATTK